MLRRFSRPRMTWRWSGLLGARARRRSVCRGASALRWRCSPHGGHRVRRRCRDILCIALRWARVLRSSSRAVGHPLECFGTLCGGVFLTVDARLATFRGACVGLAAVWEGPLADPTCSSTGEAVPVRGHKPRAGAVERVVGSRGQLVRKGRFPSLLGLRGHERPVGRRVGVVFQRWSRLGTGPLRGRV